MDERRIELRLSGDAETRFDGAHPTPYTVVMGWNPTSASKAGGTCS